MLRKNGNVNVIGIYGILTVDGTCLYVGGGYIADRYNNHDWHLSRGKYENTNKSIIQVYYDSVEGLDFIVFEECTHDELDEKETIYIQKYGDTICNDEKKGKRRKSKSTPEETEKRRQANCGINNPRCNKLDNEKIIEIKTMLNNGVPLQEIARKFNISVGYVSAIKNGTRWGHIQVFDII